MSRYSALPVLFLGVLSTRLFLGLLRTRLFLGLISARLIYLPYFGDSKSDLRRQLTG